MKYLLDTANLDAIRYYTDIFPIAGVTSNPSIVKKEGKIDFFAHMNEIRSIIGMDKTLHIQVTALDTDGMLRDAETILNKVLVHGLQRQSLKQTATGQPTTSQN